MIIMIASEETNNLFEYFGIIMYVNNLIFKIKRTIYYNKSPYIDLMIHLK